MSIFFYTHYILLFLIQSQATDPGGRTKGWQSVITLLY